jgi:hypothetical protein
LEIYDEQSFSLSQIIISLPKTPRKASPETEPASLERTHLYAPASFSWMFEITKSPLLKIWNRLDDSITVESGDD